MIDLIKLAEPALLFHHNQPLEDPRDGLTLFGPLDAGKPHGIRAGVIGTQESIHRFNRWVARIQGPISNMRAQVARPPFPGFEAAFRMKWGVQPVHELVVPEDEIIQTVRLDDK